MMNTAPFQRRIDKFAYVLGTTITIAFSYTLGRYPHTLIWPLVALILIGLIGQRYINYLFYETIYVMYIFDFCYLGNWVLLAYVLFFPGSPWLLSAVFVQANGALAFAIGAFRNSLVYHKIDMLTSLAIHSVPMIISFHLRWSVVPE